VALVLEERQQAGLQGKQPVGQGRGRGWVSGSG
jgi:hypothetical protein